MAWHAAQPWHYPDVEDKNFELHGRSLQHLSISFAILVLLTLVFLYIRRACRRQGTATPRPNGPNGCQLGPVGLDPMVISSLPVLLYRQAAEKKRIEEDEMCSICLSTFDEGEKVKMLPKCTHTFHPDCIDEWLRTRSSCPLCRASIGDLQRAEGEEAV